jgi:hypothetical protein
MSAESALIATDAAAMCPVCEDPLPLPSIEKILHGGRPKKYCNARCKRLASRRQGLIANMKRWRERALARGNTQLADVLEQRIAHYLGRPYVRRPAQST